MDQPTQESVLEHSAEQLLKISTFYINKIKTATTDYTKKYYRKKLVKNNELFATLIQTSQAVAKVKKRRDLQAIIDAPENK